MEPNNPGNVQYDRWNEDNINMNVGASQSQSTMMRFYNRVCVGSPEKAMKTAGALAALFSIYIIGYVTGYYIHRC